MKKKSHLRIGGYQGPSEPCAIEQNGKTALRLLAEAHENGVDFACMPECFLSGYGAPDQLRAGAVSVRGSWFKDWLNQCRFGDMVSIVGFEQKKGDKLFNSAAIIQRGRLLGIYNKSIPGSPYEAQVTTFVSRFPVYRAHGITFGVLICYEGAQVEPAMLLTSRGARIIFEPHYSFIPMEHVEHHRHRVRNTRIARAVDNGVWYVKSNTVTAPGRKMGDVEGFGYGDSFILDDIGQPVAESGMFTRGWITADIPKRSLTEKRPSKLALVPKATRTMMSRLYAR